jgi:hypothetical protein
MFAPIAPVVASKLLVIISISLIFIRFFLSGNIRIDKLQLFIILLLLPGIFITMINFPENLVRFVIIFILILSIPKFDYSFDNKFIMNFSSLILIYLISTQIFITLDFNLFTSFRDNWYPNEYSYVWEDDNLYGITTASNILIQIGKLRAGGLMHNPNVLASVIILYFFMFVILYDHSKLEKTLSKKLFYFFIIFIVFLSLCFTFSRTYLVSFVLFYLLRQFATINFQKLIIKFWHLFTLPVILLILYLLYEVVISSFYKIDGSMNIKLSTIADYLTGEDIFVLIFGGVHDVFFDMEYGYWLGSIGIVGIIGMFILFVTIYLENKILRIYFLIFLFMSVGNSLFYGLLTGAIALNIIIISSSLNTKDQER